MPVAMDYQYRPDLKLQPQTNWPNPPFRHCLLALEEGRISLRDINVLQELAYSQFLTRDQIHFFCMSSVGRTTVRRRLEALQRMGLITAVRWEEPRPDNSPAQRVAYALALNGARLLQHYFGRFFPWRPGTAQKHLRRILAILAANEFRMSVESQARQLAAEAGQEEVLQILKDWQIFTHDVGPTARFMLGAQVVLFETPRDDEDVFLLAPERYNRWLEDNPLVLFMVPNDALAARVFNKLHEALGPERLLFTTDSRAFESAVHSPGYLWQWSAGGVVEAISLI